ncbi:ECF RNA polymerase sigma factor SigW [bacterium HR10]|nr:ECF RNA polymerase sigma factor SigW [bacterium HR10]
MATAAAHLVSDVELARASARGEMEAFERLYRTYHRRVYALCLRLVGNVADAEDLTQEVFLHLYRKISSFRGDSAFTTWLHRLTVNLVLMHLRRRRPNYEPMDDTELKALLEAHRADDGMSRIVDRIALERALMALPIGYRTILVLHDLEGYGHEEIARMLGVTVGTTKSQLHKARLRLRRMLKRRR